MNNGSLKKRRTRYLLSFIVLGVLVMFFFVLSVKTGSINISWTDVFRAFGGVRGVKQ